MTNQLGGPIPEDMHVYFAPNTDAGFLNALIEIPNVSPSVEVDHDLLYHAALMMEHERLAYNTFRE